MKSKALIFSLVLFTAGIAFVGSGEKKEADIDEVLQIMSGTWINSKYDVRPDEARKLCAILMEQLTITTKQQMWLHEIIASILLNKPGMIEMEIFGIKQHL